MEALLAGSNLDKLEEGSILKGTIVEIRPTEVVVDIGGKSEGVVHASEFVDMSELQVGSDLEVFLEKLEDKEGNPVISYDKAEQKKNWEKIGLIQIYLDLEQVLCYLILKDKLNII